MKPSPRANSWIQLLAGRPVTRYLADRLFEYYAQFRVQQLDHEAVNGIQARTLLRLVNQACETRFGRDHGFARIRTVADYQRQVPLRNYEAFWKDYWGPVFPRLFDCTWPGKIPYVAQSSGTTSGITKYIPVSHQMTASNRRAALTALALATVAFPQLHLFRGRLFFLGGSTDLQALADGVLVGDLSGIAAHGLVEALRPYTFPPRELALLADWDQKLQRLAETSSQQPITMVSGVPSWLLAFFERLRAVTGRDRVTDIWPSLRLLIHGGTKMDPYRDLFRRHMGLEHIAFFETYPASEGFIGAEDPRYGLLRLLPDHQIFFEFVPLEDSHRERPTRHTVANVELGVPYEVVLTTCAGLWSYRLGDTVCFEKRKPPLFRFTGRTRYYLSAFGEHLISEEIESAVAAAAKATNTAVIDFHVGPIFPIRTGTVGWHRYIIEFLETPSNVSQFAMALDVALGDRNRDYRTHRQGDLTIRPPEIWPIPRGGFAAWLRTRGQIGGQHKVPRMDNNGIVTEELSRWLQTQSIGL